MSSRTPGTLDTAGFEAAPERRSVDPFPSTDTLQVLANDSRQAILHALYAATDTPLEFSVLRGRADVDGSARFNYHLQELLGQFVRETPEGYVLTDDGEGFIDALSVAPGMNDCVTDDVAASD